MTPEWNETRLQQLINDETEESLSLEYKAADALSKTDQRKKDEITKDVAAMANSAGGTIIYGIKEYDDSTKKHLPEKITPIDLTQFSKEWLEQVIMNIRPRIGDMTIFPVTLTTVPNGVVYVVEIPQSATAHQSNDYRYYKRFNFMAVPMEDYEIRDVMSRRKDAKIELRFRIEINKHTVDENESYLGLRKTDQFGRSLPPKLKTFFSYTLKTQAVNIGNVYAQYIVAQITVPYDLLPHYSRSLGSDDTKVRVLNLEDVITYSKDNTVRDVIKGNMVGPPERAAARYVPILPSMHQNWEDTTLTDKFKEITWVNSQIKWVVYCDNAEPNRGENLIKDIPIIDRRNETNEED